MSPRAPISAYAAWSLATDRPRRAAPPETLARPPPNGSRSRQRRLAEAVAEGGEVQPVDDPVAVDVECRHVIRVGRPAPERTAEGGEVQPVDDPVAGDVPEQAEQPGGRRQRVVAARRAVAVAVQR